MRNSPSVLYKKIVIFEKHHIVECVHIFFKIKTCKSLNDCHFKNLFDMDYKLFTSKKNAMIDLILLL